MPDCFLLCDQSSSSFFSIFPQLRNKEPFTDPSIDFSGEVTVIKFLSFKVLIFVGNATCCPKKDMQG